MNRLRKLAAIVLSVLTISGVCIVGNLTAGASGTGAGLAEWALNAYYSGWSYSWGGASPGAVDCSGLIYSYCGGERIAMIETCTEQGSVSAGIPRVHGLGLWRPGHVGVYIENNMEVDARGDDYGVCYQEIGGWNNWTYWFKLAAVSYPTEGWEKFNGNYYYYENGQYIVNTSRTIDGTTYYFDSLGRSGDTPSDTSSKSSSSSNSDSSSSSSSSSKSSAPTTWSRGSSGDEVEKIQKRLKELGFYNGEIDGDFGEQTESAYRAFQEAAGVVVDGIAGSDREVLYSDDAPVVKSGKKTDDEDETEPQAEPETEAETEPETEPETEEVVLENGDFSDEVAQAQEKLYALGYLSVEATGYYGDLTTEAVKAFQTQNGLEATGVIDSATFELLLSEDAVSNPTPVAKETQASEPAAVAGPVQVTTAMDTVNKVFSAENNQTYANNATSVVTKTNQVTKEALEKSSSVIPAITTAQVKRTANVWMWFIIVAVILGATALVFVIKDKKETRYQKYVAKKRKKSMKAQLNTRW